MYTLTEISTDKENVPFYQKLGEKFSPIDRETSPGEFEKAYNALYKSPSEKLFKEKDVNSDIYCLVVTEGGRDIIPLYKNNFYYIVSENGKTFKNLTYK